MFDKIKKIKRSIKNSLKKSISVGKNKKNEINYVIEVKDTHKTYIYFYLGNKKMTFKQGIMLLKKSSSFRDLVTRLLQKIEGPFMWKLTAINRKLDYNRSDKYFKFTTIKSQLHKIQDPTKFHDKFTDVYEVSPSFVYFSSPSGNGLLVPKNVDPNSHLKNTYVHFSNFIKHAPHKQTDEFWITFSNIIDNFFKLAKDGDKLFLNTSGKEVPWLHVRFDIVPDKIVWNH